MSKRTPPLTSKEKTGLRAVEKQIASWLANGALDEESKDGARMLMVAALVTGPDADRVAMATGLNRDKFVRPRAKRLRENGRWVGRTVRCGWFEAEEEGPGGFLIALIVDVLVAEGIVVASDAESSSADPK